MAFDAKHKKAVASDAKLATTMAGSANFEDIITLNPKTQSFGESHSSSVQSRCWRWMRSQYPLSEIKYCNIDEPYSRWSNSKPIII